MKTACNPFLPLNVYIPDGEPHVFGDRLYLFGSHDQEGGDTFCALDYEFYSCPIDDLANWTSNGINYSAKQDPFYSEKRPYMYAPDVVKGNDVVYAQALVRMVAVSPRIKEYIIRLANATRAHEALSTGCSPRASLALMRSCQSLAAYEGREYVTPHDVVEMFKVVFSHRLTLKLRCRAEYKSVDNVLDLIMASVALPDEDVR